MCVFLGSSTGSCSQLALHGAIEGQDHSHPVNSSRHLHPPFSVPTRLTAEQSTENESTAWLHFREVLEARAEVSRHTQGYMCRPILQETSLHIRVQRGAHVPAAGQQVNGEEETHQDVDNPHSPQRLQPLPQWAPTASQSQSRGGRSDSCLRRIV